MKKIATKNIIGNSADKTIRLAKQFSTQKSKILDITVRAICDKQFVDITWTEKIILGNFSIDLLPEVDAGRKIDRPTKKIKDQTDRREMIYELTLK